MSAITAVACYLVAVILVVFFLTAGQDR